MVKLQDLHPIRDETLIRVPTFIQGTLADALIPEYEKSRKNNSVFAFKDGRGENQELRDSNPLIVGLVNKVLAPSFRTPTPTDNIYETIFPMIQGRFYTDLNAFDVWKDKPVYERNNELWKQVIELAEQKQGSVKFPFRVQGVYCVPDETEKGYGVRIEPAPNFRIIEDKRISLPSETKFNSLDENGMIIPNGNGRFQKYTLGNGLSRVFLLSIGSLGSYWDDLLDDSSGIGRVVAIDA